MAEPGLIISVLGAESTGKTALSQALTTELQTLTGLKVAWVPELLRSWCEERGRTPRMDEQQAIAQAQGEAADAAALTHDLVVCDTAPLMVAIYSQYVFGDDTVLPSATAWHRRCAATLLTALDLPWVSDGLQREGPHVREPIDSLLRQGLQQGGLSWSLVSGAGPARLAVALDALSPVLRPLAPRRSGLFTRWAQRDAESAARSWVCTECDDPDCEHRSLRQQRRQASY